MSTLSQPESLAIVWPVHRFSVADYRRMGETGVLTSEDRVELLEGWIVEKMNLNPPHAVSVMLSNELLSKVLPAGWHSRVQMPITTTDSEPEPDLAIVRGITRDYAHRHPTADDIALVVEVADSSLTRDRYKRSIYGRAGVACYWIVNLAERKVEVYSEPTGAAEEAGYRRQEDFSDSQQVPLMIDGRQIGLLAVADLLP